MEPPPFPIAPRERPRPSTPRQPRLHLSAIRALDPRSALALAGLAAAAVGLVGTEAGLVWIVAGVWTVRAMAGAPVGLAWGIACIAAGLRWGTLGLADLEVATRLAGPTLGSGAALTRAGMAAAFAGALLGEVQVNGFGARTWGERAASALAIATLAPLFALPGPTDPAALATMWWVAFPAAVTAVCVLGRPVAQRVPGWSPAVLAGAGLMLGMATS